MLRASEQPERGRGAAGEARYHVPGGGAKGVRAGDAPFPTPRRGAPARSKARPRQRSRAAPVYKFKKN